MMKCLFCVFFLWSGMTRLSAQAPASQQQGDSVYVIEDSVLIGTRSGVDLSAIVVRRKGDVGMVLPVVLFYTTYCEGAGDVVFGKKAADRGYVGVVVYARGIRTDLRFYAPFEHEGTDVYDAIDWISKQGWCNGSVGMYGGSYTGYAQWATVKNRHRALKTIVPQVAVMPGFDFPMENGVPLPHVLSWSNDYVYKAKGLPRGLAFDYFNSGVAFCKLDSLAGVENPIFQGWLKHAAYDGYWQAMVPTPEEYARLDIPVLTTTGYYDGSQIGAIAYFKGHCRYNAAAEHYFVIGPYDHWGGQRSAAKRLMGYEIDSVADVRMEGLAYDWLDYVLKGKAKPELLKDRVNYEVMGANVWKHAGSLAEVSNGVLVFYLADGVLEAARPKGGGYSVQRVDFKDRVKQHSYYTPELVFDSLDAGNGLVYESGVFEDGFSINGSLAGRLYATVNKRDMDVSLAVYERMADGRYFFLSRYVGRASYAQDRSKRKLLEVGKKVCIGWDNTRFVSRWVAKGSRLVVVLNVNKHPFEVVNYGSGKPVSEETIMDAGEPLQVRWHDDSFIEVPVWRD
jgi:uncharacterized protein